MNLPRGNVAADSKKVYEELAVVLVALQYAQCHGHCEPANRCCRLSRVIGTKIVYTDFSPPNRLC